MKLLKLTKRRLEKHGFYKLTEKSNKTWKYHPRSFVKNDRKTSLNLI